MRKIITIISSLFFTLILGFCVVWACVNFDKVKYGINGTELYTRTELEEYGNNMYNQGLQDKKEYLEQIDTYRDTITHLNDEISKYKYTIKVNNEDIDSLTNQRDGYKKELEDTKVLLEEEKLKTDSSSETISDLENKVSNLNKSIESKDKQIADLKKDNVDALKSIDYYENFIKTLETESSVVATFVYDGQVVHLEVITKGSYSTYTNPTDTDYSKFNYWTVNNERVTLSEYPLNTNTTFVANIEKSYDVTFMVDDIEYASQIVVENNTISLPEEPTKENYTFLGWSLDGINVIEDIESLGIINNVTYYAVFEEIEYVVTYMVGDNVVKSESLMHHSSISYILQNTDTQVFKGWSLDGSSLISEDYVVTSNVTLMALFEDKTFTVSYMSNYMTLGTEDVVINSSPKGLVIDSSKGRTLEGWSLDGFTIVDINTLSIVEDIDLRAIWDYHPVAEKITLNANLSNIESRTWTDGTNWYYSYGSSQYKWNSDFTGYSNQVWTGLTSFSGEYICTLFGDVYYLNGKDQYRLVRDTSTFEKCNLGLELVYADGFWSNGDNVYYSLGESHYKLIKESLLLESISWNCSIQGYEVVSYGGYSYWISDVNSTTAVLYILSNGGSTWESANIPLSWLSDSSFDKSNFSGFVTRQLYDLSVIGDCLYLNFHRSNGSLSSDYTSFVFNPFSFSFIELSGDKYSDVMPFVQIGFECDGLYFANWEKDYYRLYI